MNLEKIEDRLEEYPRVEKVYYYLTNKFDNCKYAIKNFYSRTRYGFEPHEVWNFDSFAVRTLLPNLRRFVETQREDGGAVGCPCDMWDDKVKGDQCHKWRETLEEILWSFEFYNKYELECDYEDLPKDYFKQYKRAMKGFQLFGKHLLSMWD